MEGALFIKVIMFTSFLIRGFVVSAYTVEIDLPKCEAYQEAAIEFNNLHKKERIVVRCRKHPKDEEA